MSINEKLAAALNNQVTAELEAAMVYLQMSYILEDLSLNGMASWMKKQHTEELEHAQKLLPPRTLLRQHWPTSRR